MYQRHPKGIGYDKLNATGTFYMFSYNGEKDGPRKRINHKDHTRRLAGVL
jgi:hypothetical protein